MTYYIRNRACACGRCRARGLMGPAVIVTVGVLLLLQTLDIVDFGRSWPVLLLVIGGVLLIGHSGSTEGHVQPTWPAPQAQPVQAQPVQPQTPPRWTTGTPPPPGPTEPNQSQDPQVKS